MSRKTKEGQVTVLSNAEPEERDFTQDPHNRGDGQITADARRAEQRSDDIAAIPAAKYFRVTKAGSFRDDGGFRATMKMGKEISDQNYDIKKLRLQGIGLEEIKEEDRTTVYAP